MNTREAGSNSLETAALVFLGIAVIFVVALDVLGGVAGVLFGDGFTIVPLDEMAGVATRLPDSLSEPRDAWPMPYRQALPGLAGFAVAGAMLAAASCAFGLGTAQAVRRSRSSRSRTARWATARDLRDLTVPGPRPGRVALGIAGRRLVAAERFESVLVVSPTQTGKTTGLAIPAILEWDGPVVATSVKSDLLRDTCERRRAIGDVRIFDPTAATGYPRSSWTPLAQCGDWESARRTADRLTKSAQIAPRGDREAEFWAHAGARFLAPLLFAAARTERVVADVVRWIDVEDQEEILDALDGPGCDAARNTVLAVWGADDRLRSSLNLTASLALEAYKDPAVASCSQTADVTPGWLLAGAANTLYLCGPADEQERLRPLFATLVREIVAEVYGRASRLGRAINPPLLLVLDEAANISPLPDLDQIASSGPGQGLQLLTVLQDLGQAHQRWGGRADTIVNNHRAKLFGPGISCARTLEYLARVLGDTERSQRSETVADRGRRSVTRSSTFRPLAPANVVRERADGSMLLVYGTVPPALVKPRLWYRDRRLRRLAGSADRS